MKLQANVVSRALKAAGMTPLSSGTPYTREGVRVKQSSQQRVRVTADLNSEAQAARLATICAEILSQAGFTIEPTNEPIAFYVTGRTS